MRRIAGMCFSQCARHQPSSGHAKRDSLAACADMLENMVKRYWRVAVTGPGIGFLLGAALFGILAVTGNPDWRNYLTVQEVLRSTFSFGGIGLLVASAAGIGSCLAVALIDRHLKKRSSTRVSLAAGGAAAGTMLLGLFVGVADAVQGSDSWMVLIPLVFVLALAAAIAAASLVASAERQHRSNPVEADEGSGLSSD